MPDGGGSCGRPDDGLPAQRPRDPEARGRAVRRPGDRLAAAGQELAPVRLRGLRLPHEAARRRAARARPRGRRPGRDAHVEPPRAPRDVHRRARRRLRHPHPEPPAAPRRQHVHREPRRGQGARRRQGALAARGAVRRPRRLRARDRRGRGRRARGRDRLRGARRLGGRERVRLPRHRRARGGRDVLHERDDRPAEGRRLLAPRDRDPRADGGGPPRPPRGRHGPPGRADVPRERLVLPVQLHAGRREAGLPGAAPRPGEPPRRLRRGGGDGERRGADDLDGDPAGARRESHRAGTSPACAR